MVTFTYAHSQVLPAAKRFKATLERQFASVTKTRIAWANVPPALVYICDQPRPGKH
jgi:phospholipid N-methyltransferase